MKIIKCKDAVDNIVLALLSSLENIYLFLLDDKFPIHLQIKYEIYLYTYVLSIGRTTLGPK